MATEHIESDRRLPPISSSDEQTVWTDVSPLLDAACNGLQDGELIHGENFSLFAAMSALEIMDPKMDSGMGASGYHSVEEAIEKNAAPVPLDTDKMVDVQRLIDVMDHLLSCEATWHMGHCLAQTVFSCIYLLRLERTISHELLHSYCRITRLICNAVVSVVTAARTHEEEDLFTMAQGLLLEGEGDEKCLSMLNAIEEKISRQLRASKTVSLKKKVREDVEPLQKNIDTDAGYCKAVLCRLRFRKHFYHVLVCMKKPQGRGLELAKKHIGLCLSELESMKQSADFLSADAHETYLIDMDDCTTASGRGPIGFDANLNSRLLAPSPPRSVKIVSWRKAHQYFMKLLHDLDVLCSMPFDPSLEVVLRFVVQFQRTNPDLVARSHLQLLLVQDGKLYGRDDICNAIFRAIPVPDVMLNHETQKCEIVMQISQLVINLLKVLCTNIAWQRRKLGKVLQEWSVTCVQLELALKGEFRDLSSTRHDETVGAKLLKMLLIWLEEQTYWIASRFLMLGFELDLYSPSEYCMVYWYLSSVLFMLLEKIQLRVAGCFGTYKKKGKKKRDLTEDAYTEMARFAPAVLLIRCYISLSEGLVMMLAALSNERAVFQVSNIFSGEQERFVQHFNLLLKAQVPYHTSYLLFKGATSQACFSHVTRVNYFEDVQRICKELRGSFASDSDRLAELRQIELVAEHNRIALNILSQTWGHDPSLKVSFKFNYHPHFAVAVVRRS